MLRWRLLLGTLLIAALVALCWLDASATAPGIWLLPLVIVVTVLLWSWTARLSSKVERVEKPWGHEEIFALVEGVYCGKLLYVNALDMNFIRSDLRKDPGCSVCGASRSATIHINQGEVK